MKMKARRKQLIAKHTKAKNCVMVLFRVKSWASVMQNSKKTEVNALFFYVVSVKNDSELTQYLNVALGVVP